MSRAAALVRGVLDDDHNEVFVGGDHDFVLLRSDSQECEVVGRVEVADDAASFVSELAHESGVLHSRCVVQSALHGDAYNEITVS